MAQKHSSSAFSYRVTRGATFLGLEHTMLLFFVVVLAMLIVAGVLTFVSPWIGQLNILNLNTFFSILWGSGAIWLSAALLTISPLVWLLDARTRAEWVKRPGFTQRLAYKVPLYVALGVVAIGKLVAWIALLAMILFGLAAFGLTTTPFTVVWVAQLIPAFVAMVIFGFTGWYLMRRAKGVDTGKSFIYLFVTFGLSLGLVLFISAMATLQAYRHYTF